MCIYYTNRNDLTYGSGEHVIPASLGGKLKLPVDYVSQQFNNDISKYEQWFIEQSVFTISRPLVGPGSRGRTSERYESKSRVSVMESLPKDGDFSLGYIKKGTPHLIPYIYYDQQSKEFLFGVDNRAGVVIADEIEKFASGVERGTGLKTKISTDPRLPLTAILFGIQNGIEGKFEAFFFKHPDNNFTVDKLHFKQIAAALRGNAHNPKYSNSKVEVQQTTSWKPQHMRVLAKMCFNVTAHLFGKEFALQACFDNFRHWIANGGNEPYPDAGFDLDNIIANAGIVLPLKAHSVILARVEKMLVGLCSVYGGKPVIFRLTNDLPHTEIGLDGFICDWKQQKEYRLIDYLDSRQHATFSK